MALSKVLVRLVTYSLDTDKTIYVNSFECPIGKLIVAADDDYLYMIAFEDSKNLDKKLQTISREIACRIVEGTSKQLQLIEAELAAYFDGKLKEFTVPVKTIGSDFQKQVWNKLQTLPYGSYQTYGDLAKSLGRSASHSRAVGSACGANSHLLVIPCHRLVASGSKGGFSCGVDRKEWLLEHEKKYTP